MFKFGPICHAIRRLEEWRCSYTLLDLHAECRCVVRFAHLPLYSALLLQKDPQGAFWFPMDRSQWEPRIRSGCSGKENFRYFVESSPVPQARRHVHCMPSQHCMTRPRVPGLFVFLDHCLSFIRSSFLASLLALFSILLFDFNAAVGSDYWIYSAEWLDHSWNLNWIECWEGSCRGQSTWTALPLKMEAIRCPETPVTNYQSSLRNMEEWNFHSSVIYLSLCGSI